jgi:hypothetical protein
MKLTILAALLVTVSAPSLAQVAVNANDLTSQSASGAEANSGSVSGAQSNNDNVNAQVGNIGVSENTNTSTSQSGAISGSNSESASNSDQNQGQDQGQSQGQMQDQSQQLDSAQANSQGVTFNQTWNTKNRKTTEIRTNNAVPLTSSSSFSSDYCGGSVSGGVSAAPLGISVGGAGTKFDKSCQSLRRAEKFGMAAVNAQNMGQPDLAGRLMSMMIWSICTSDTNGTEVTQQTAQACDRLLLLGSDRSTASAVPAQPLAAKAREARTRVKGQITPEAASVAIANNDQANAAQVAASKPPRP